MEEERTIEVHCFQIHKNRDPKTIYNLNKENGINLYEEINKKFISFVDDTTDLGAKKNNTYRIKNADKSYAKYWGKDDQNQLFYGYLETGQYGTEYDIYDTHKKENSGTIKKEQAIMMPFFFMICIPKNKNTGFIILERIRNFGINEIFTKIFKEFVRSINQEYQLTHNRYVSEEIMRKFIEDGDLRQITLTKNSLPAKVAKRLNLRDFDTEDFTLQLTIKAKKKNVFTNTKARNKIIKALDEKYKNFFVGEDFESIGFDKNTSIGVKSTLDGAKKTIDLSDTMKMRPYYTIYVNLNTKGFSDFRSILEKIINFINTNLEYDLYDEKINAEII